MQNASNGIERIDNPTPEEFYREFVSKGRPVILTGIASTWPACGRWTPRFFADRFGDTPVQVEVQRRQDPTLHWGEKEVLQTTLARYVELLSSESPKYYLNFASVMAQLPELHRDVGSLDAYQVHHRPYPERVRRKLRLSPIFWFGPAGAFTSLHRDPSDNLLVQVLGRKRLTLFAPEDTPNLYAPWHENCSSGRCLGGYSPVNVAQPDLERFPRLSRARGVDVLLGPGEILFIPIHWWHYVSSVDVSISVSYWWFHRLSQWHWSTAAWVPLRSTLECQVRQWWRARAA
ncbi:MULTISPECIES: cupin-like domain-containing protein [Myxococcus]|uniref:cupin-like domain-containing protein n=1 Tax=Myxococcus TaxID=32 RepID=UPI001144FB99|nr:MULTISPECIES: cupin-like domain-containing protein [Myxococcus]NOK00899.1 cupin-like domain-containing protein [Myxococcus xanthus]